MGSLKLIIGNDSQKKMATFGYGSKLYDLKYSGRSLYRNFVHQVRWRSNFLEVIYL